MLCLPPARAYQPWDTMRHVQACASTSVINYAPELLEQTGMQRHADSILYSSSVGLGKVNLPAHSVAVCVPTLCIARLET